MSIVSVNIYVPFRIYMCGSCGGIHLLLLCLDLVVKIVKCTCRISMGISLGNVNSLCFHIRAYRSCADGEWIIFTTASFLFLKYIAGYIGIFSLPGILVLAILA